MLQLKVKSLKSLDLIRAAASTYLCLCCYSLFSVFTSQTPALTTWSHWRPTTTWVRGFLCMRAPSQGHSQVWIAKKNTLARSSWPEDVVSHFISWHNSLERNANQEVMYLIMRGTQLVVWCCIYSAKKRRVSDVIVIRWFFLFYKLPDILTATEAA